MECPPGTEPSAGDGEMVGQCASGPAALFEHLQREGERRREGKFRQGGPVRLTACTGASAHVHLQAQALIRICSRAGLNAGWHPHSSSQGSVLCAPTPQYHQHLPGHTEPGQPAQPTREGVWPQVGARALSPEGSGTTRRLQAPFSWGQNQVSA